MEVDENIVTSEADEGLEKERLSVVATFGILIATIAATIAGSLAALSSFHADDADTQRVAWATYSNEQLLGYNQSAGTANASEIATVEDLWREQLLLDQAGNTSDPTLRAALNVEATLAGGGSSNPPHASRPTFASPSPPAWCLGLNDNQPYDCAYEVASAYTGTESNDDSQERAYIACVSMLAIALFLFALSKMLSQPSMERLFLGLGALITVAAIGWTAAVNYAIPAPAPSGPAIRTYERGWLKAEAGGRPAKVDALLARATSDDPSLADAWQQLGEEELLHPVNGPGHQCRSALSALTNAWQLRGAADDRDRLAIAEALCGEPRQAIVLLHQPPHDPSDVEAGPALALAQLASGRLGPALMTLDAAFKTMEHPRIGAAGPVIRTYWFDQLLPDVHVLGLAGVRPHRVNAFIERMEHDETEATLADFDLTAPRPAQQASLTMAITPAGLGSEHGLVPVALVLRYSGLQDGDVISAIWHQSSTSTVESDKFINPVDVPGTNVVVVGKPGGPKAGTGTFVLPTLDFVTPVPYQIDLSLDAVPAGPLIQIKVPGSAGRYSPPPPVPLKPVPMVLPTTTTTHNRNRRTDNHHDNELFDHHHDHTTTTTTTTTTPNTNQQGEAYSGSAAPCVP